MAIFSPTSAFMSVDLPTLGRPTKVTKPLRWVSVMGSILAALAGLLIGRGLGDGDIAGAGVPAEDLVDLTERLGALDEDGRDTAAAAARRAAGEDQPLGFDHLAGLRHVAEVLRHEAADRVDVLVLDVDPEQFADLVGAEAGAHAITSGGELDDLVGTRVVLVVDLADELFEQVFERDDAGDSAVLVDREA